MTLQQLIEETLIANGWTAEEVIALKWKLETDRFAPVLRVDSKDRWLALVAGGKSAAKAVFAEGMVIECEGDAATLRDGWYRTAAGEGVARPSDLCRIESVGSKDLVAARINVVSR